VTHQLPTCHAKKMALIASEKAHQTINNKLYSQYAS